METNTPFFSVIVPVYNKAPHIHRSISSILGQTFTDFELLIIDDASTDNSINEIHKFSDPRIRLFHRDSPGPGGYAARNFGIKEARAEWIAFLDADDEWESNHLSEHSELISRYPECQIISTSWRVVENIHGKSESNRFRKSHRGTGSFVIDFYKYLQSSINGAAPFWTGVISIKRKVLIEAGGFPEGKSLRGGDVDTWLRSMAHSKYAAWSSKITAKYFRDSVNMVTKSVPFTGSCEKNTIDRLLEMEADKKLRTALKKFANARLISGYIQTVSSGLPPSEDFYRNLHIKYLNPNQIILVILSFLPHGTFSYLHRAGNAAKAILKWFKRSKGNFHRLPLLGFTLSALRVIRGYLNFMHSPKRILLEANFHCKYVDTGKNTLCGYYDVSPFQPDNPQNILVISTNASPFFPPDNSKPCKIHIFDWINNQNVKTIDETYAWNWQQGCRSGWLNSEKIIYNVFENMKYFAKVYDCISESTRNMESPVMAWYKDELYCTLDFKLLNKRNIDYGYRAHKPTSDFDESISILDQENSKLIWSINFTEAFQRLPICNLSPETKATAFFNHPMFSPDGQRMIFLFRYLEKMRKFHYTFCWNRNNNQAYPVLSEKVSHYAWIDGERFIYWGAFAGIEGYHIMNVSTGKIETIQDTLPDGHPTKAWKGGYVIDSYVYPKAGRVLRWIDIASGHTEKIATIPEFPSWGYVSRCDPHPSMNDTNEFIQIDTMTGARRRVAVISNHTN